MNRGSSQRSSSHRRHSIGFNEAPIHESGKCSLYGLAVVSGIPASMRPRFMNQGSGDRASVEDTALVASMRPRFMNRGSFTVLRIQP